MQRRSIAIIVITLFIGAFAGTLLGEVFRWLLPEGVVKDFFLTSAQFDLAGLVGNDSGVIVLNLVMLTVKIGLSLKINFTSIIGMAGAYYFLRYFK